MSNRKVDMGLEKELGEFLDSYLYPNITKEGFVAERQQDINMQYAGVDVVLGKALIDEKAAFYHPNISTFAFEVNSIQKGKLSEGWLLRPLKTNYYMLIWPTIRCEKKNEQWVRKELKEVKKDDFEVCEAYLIKKNSIYDYLLKKGLTKEKINEAAKEIRKTNQRTTNIDDVYFCLSDQLEEKPINIIINKEELFKMSQKAYLVSKMGCGKLK